jgi:hypothetical protein
MVLDRGLFRSATKCRHALWGLPTVGASHLALRTFAEQGLARTRARERRRN